MLEADAPGMLKGRPVSVTNMYKEDFRTHDEYQYRIKDKELLEVAKLNELKRARLMIDDDANPLVADMGGFSALFFAAQNGHADMCRLLIKHGATFPDEGSEKGLQLKGYCIYYGHTEALALLEQAWAAARGQ